LGKLNCIDQDVSVFSRESQTGQLAKGILDFHNPQKKSNE